jgi:hypothetical protein
MYAAVFYVASAWVFLTRAAFIVLKVISPSVHFARRGLHYFRFVCLHVFLLGQRQQTMQYEPYSSVHQAV